jgi:glycosyltransferase involved in cell wall biosynthesis
MADLQAALIAPFAKLTNKKHFLWYAHSHKSLYLSWASIWVNGIISSTQGSSPIQGKKVSLIGQSVNPDMFPQRVPGKVRMDRLIHVGRLDRSKNIHLLIDSTLEIRKLDPTTTLTLVGSSANTESSSYFAELNRKYESEIKSGVISFVPSMPRSLLPSVLSTYDVFIHGYRGSLDKTLVEATFSGMPVITLNPEYIAIFGTWSNANNPDLYREYVALHAKAPNEITEELHRRWGIANTSHSSAQWSQKLSEILESDLKSRVESRTEGLH